MSQQEQAKADLLFLDPSKHSNDSPFLVNANATTTTATAKPPAKPKFEKLPPSSALARARDFLPLMANANKKLEEDMKNNTNVNIENVDETKPYISMKLALGVLEEQKGVTEENITIPTQQGKEGKDGKRPVIEILESSDISDSSDESDDSEAEDEGEDEDVAMKST